MKTKQGYVLHEVADTFLVMPTGKDDGLKRLITLNDTGAFLWRLLEQGATREQLIDKTEEEYDAPRDVIARDVDFLLGKLRDAELLDE